MSVYDAFDDFDLSHSAMVWQTRYSVSATTSRLVVPAAVSNIGSAGSRTIGAEASTLSRPDGRARWIGLPSVALPTDAPATLREPPATNMVESSQPSEAVRMKAVQVTRV